MKMKVVILLGSIRKGRQSYKLAYYLQKRLIDKGIQTELIDLARKPLPVFGQEEGDNSNVEYIGDQLQQSDAIIFVTPEYHGSFSGVLKNAIDYYWSEFQKKPIGVATASAGRMGGINASTQLQHVILSLGAYPLPLKLLVPEIYKTFDDSFNSLSENTTKSAKKFLDEFLWFTEAIVNKKEVGVQTF